METRGLGPPTWLLADRLTMAGIAVVTVLSFASEATAADINVIFWTWAPLPPHQIRGIDDEHRLPKDARSWR